MVDENSTPENTPLEAMTDEDKSALQNAINQILESKDSSNLSNAVSEEVAKEAKRLEEKGLGTIFDEGEKALNVEIVSPEAICKVYHSVGQIISKAHEMHHADEDNFQEQVNIAGAVLSVLYGLIGHNVTAMGIAYYNLTNQKN